jgi:dTDP-glucose 4,6-dehydratase
VAGKFLVLGSNSFSGASFVAHLLAKDRAVIGCSRGPEPHRAFLPYKWESRERAAPGQFAFHQLDINRDLDELMALIGREKPTHVVNFAAQSMVAESWKNPDHWFMTNVLSTVRLHERLRQCDFLERYVHVTTPEVYGNTVGFIKEDAPYNPSTPYAVSRAAADMSLKTFFANYRFPVVFTRAANVFGPGQQLYRVIPRTILFARTGRKLQLHGGGHSERSFIHIGDVSDATERIALNGVAGEAYHISTDRIVTVRELVQLICERMGMRFEQFVEEVGERAGKDAAYRLDSSKVRGQLGWSDRIPLEAGLDETVAWVDRWIEDLRAQESSYVHRA